MKKLINFVLSVFFCILYTFAPNLTYGEESLLIFAGEATIPFMEKIKPLYESKENVRLHINYGGSGVVMSQIMLSKRGDIFIPGSEDYMERAKKNGLIYGDTTKSIAYLVPVLVVKKGNPKSITGLKDLVKKDVKIVIGNPENVCLGGYAVEIFEQNLSAEEQKIIKRKIINFAGGCDKVYLAVKTGQADVAIGWHNFSKMEGVEIIKLNKREIRRVSYIPATVVIYSKKRDLAKKFINFLNGDEAKKILKNEGYFVTTEEVKRFIDE
ncbi:MAG: molybdate ABC transporter substrate-binding protein [Proteobacteria bacterium]|nr:molybdate ABC transporter substrate-binding protein [Pseudomonadota bacterium]